MVDANAAGSARRRVSSVTKGAKIRAVESCGRCCLDPRDVPSERKHPLNEIGQFVRRHRIMEGAVSGLRRYRLCLEKTAMSSSHLH